MRLTWGEQEYMSNIEDAPYGWGFPTFSRKAHFFPARQGTSLCGRWGFYFGPRQRGNDDSPDNCAACKRKHAFYKKHDEESA